MSGQLGCAETYTAALHWRGGGRVYGAPSLERLAQVSWSRTLNDLSDAQVVIAKVDVSPECCEAIGRCEPWIHELTVYRDGELVWQGPVVRVSETRTTFTITAGDVTAWLDRLVNTYLIRFAAGSPPPRLPGPVTEIAETIIKLNLNDALLSVPPDYPAILPYIVRMDPAKIITYENDGSTNTAIWTEFVGNILRDLIKRGLAFTTVGRSLVLRTRPTLASPPRARLSLVDFLGDIEVVKDGTQTATSSYATNKTEQNLSDRSTEMVGVTGSAWGRVDSIVRIQSENATAVELQDAAWEDLSGRLPTPVSVNVPDGAQLSPSAPIQISELVCGERIDVVTEEYCIQVAQGFILSDVQVAWGDNGETVGISLIPLATGEA